MQLPARRTTLGASLLLAVPCGPAGPNKFAVGNGADYLEPALREAVEELKAGLAASPTDESTVASQAEVTP